MTVGISNPQQFLGLVNNLQSPLKGEAGLIHFGRTLTVEELKEEERKPAEQRSSFKNIPVKLPLTAEKLEEITETTEPVNWYYTPNIHDHSYKRGNEQVTFITSLFVDIDNCSSWDKALEALAAVYRADLPEPSFTVFSGHGVHVYWNLSFNLQVTYYGESWKRTLRVIREKISQEFPVGATYNIDNCITDYSRFLRIPSSINCKDKEKPIKTVFLSYKPLNQYSFLDDFFYPYVETAEDKSKKTIQALDLAFLKSAQQASVKHAGKLTSKKNAVKQARQALKTSSGQISSNKDSPVGKRNSYNDEVVADILTLIRLRCYDMTGCRDSILFSLKLMKQSESFIRTVNSSFTDPLPDKELESCVFNGVEYKNFPTRAYMLQELSITPVEEWHMKRLVNEQSAELERRIKKRMNKHEKDLNKAFRDLKQLYLPAYAHRSGNKQPDRISASVVGVSVRTLKSWRQRQEVEDIVTEKARIIDNLITCIEEMAETVLLLASDDQTRSRLKDLDKRAILLKARAIQLRELVADNEELHGSLLRVNKLEDKCTQLIFLSKVA